MADKYRAVFIYYLLAVSLLVIFLFYIQKSVSFIVSIEYFAFDSIEQLTQRWKRIHWLFVHKSYF